MENVRFRNYLPTDYPAVKKILEEGKLFIPTWDTEERLKRFIENNPSSIILAVIKNEIIGTIYITDELFPLVWHLVVKKEYRNQGIGKMLMSEAKKVLKEHGHTEISVSIDESNEQLKNWYAKQGFKEVEGAYRSMWDQL